jgi:hypothetical protein
VAPPSRTNPQFRPRATLGLLYLFGLFFLFCFVLAAPTFWHVFRTTEPGPEQQEIAKQAVQEAMSLTRLGLALGLAALVTLIGGRFRLLPGTRG